MTHLRTEGLPHRKVHCRLGIIRRPTDVLPERWCHLHGIRMARCLIGTPLKHATSKRLGHDIDRSSIRQPRDDGNTKDGFSDQSKFVYPLRLPTDCGTLQTRTEEIEYADTAKRTALLVQAMVRTLPMYSRVNSSKTLYRHAGRCSPCFPRSRTSCGVYFICTPKVIEFSCCRQSKDMELRESSLDTFPTTQVP